MLVKPVKTHKITTEDKDLFKILDQYIPQLLERSIIAITSKIVSITEGRAVGIGAVDKDSLIEQESQYYLSRKENPFNVALTITRDTLIASAGIDESNGNGYYILWPKDPQASANKIRDYLRESRGIREIGVIITDSKTSPLRWGVTAIAIAYSGFVPLKNYIGKPDIFGKKLEYTKMNIADNLASAAAVVMGEGNEQTPMAVIAQISDIVFQENNPTEKELKDFKISVEGDIYTPLLKSANWKKGKGK